jgi:hypothetical protein
VRSKGSRPATTRARCWRGNWFEVDVTGELLIKKRSLPKVRHGSEEEDQRAIRIQCLLDRG